MQEYDQDNIMNIDIENNQNSINDSNEITNKDCQINFNYEQNNFNGSDIRIIENINNEFGFNDYNESAKKCNYEILNENLSIQIEKCVNGDEETNDMKKTFNEGKVFQCFFNSLSLYLFSSQSVQVTSQSSLQELEYYLRSL